ncbi:MAG: homoserine O-succinyltransferase, partial [Alphaproteobacteria bacterium]|nr:homoserine O-succinyltransferase [Alphaproteobacteria bacterium]
KIKTELQIARLLGATPLQIELSLIRIGNHVSRNTAEDHLLTFYQTWEAARHRKFDGFITTGTPVETIPYEDVTYWREMQRIFDWTTTNTHSTINVCWGAMAALHHFHGVPKHQLKEKAFGVYRQNILKPSSPFLIGFSDEFAIPISRWAEVRTADVAACADVDVLACSEETGVCIAQSRGTRRLFVLDHMEYDAISLGDEYARDVKAGVAIKLPRNYFPCDDAAQAPPNRWRPHAHLFISNWINEIYQTAPFDLDRIGRSSRDEPVSAVKARRP